MKHLSREKRLIENEVIFSAVNKSVQEFIENEKNFSNEDKIMFYCECSRPDCLERIKLTSLEYKELHKDKKHFVILIGHEFPEVEKIVKKNDNYQVVEKYITPPKPEDINLALNTINESL